MELDVMEAYAQKSLKIANLERQVEELKSEAEAIKSEYISKGTAKSWFSSIDENYVFLADDCKKEIFDMLGKKPS